MGDKYVDLIIVSQPKYVTFTCPHCLNDIELNYDDFEKSQHSSYWGDWSNTICNLCDKDISINTVEYD